MSSTMISSHVVDLGSSDSDANDNGGEDKGGVDCFALRSEEEMIEMIDEMEDNNAEHSDICPLSHWAYYLVEEIEFPFRACMKLRKRDGTSEETIVEVVKFFDKEDSIREDKVHVQVDYNGILLTCNLFDLCPINASKRTLLAMQLWEFDQYGECTIVNDEHATIMEH